MCNLFVDTIKLTITTFIYNKDCCIQLTLVVILSKHHDSLKNSEVDGSSSGSGRGNNKEAMQNKIIFTFNALEYPTS